MPSRKIRRLTLLALCLGAGSFVAGCGQKGPLYLPVKEGEKRKEEKTPETMKPASPSGNT